MSYFLVKLSWKPLRGIEFHSNILNLNLMLLRLTARWTLVTSLGIICPNMSGMQLFRCNIIEHDKWLLFCFCSWRIVSGSLSLNCYSLTQWNMQRAPEKPCLNDVTEVGTWRKTLFTMGIVLVVMTLLPVWDELAEELGIGLVTTLWSMSVLYSKSNFVFRQV